MGVATEARRSLYATVGAGQWAVDTVWDGSRWVREVVRHPQHWIDRMAETYEDLAERGESTLRRGAQQRDRLGRQVARGVRRVPGVSQAEGELAGMAASEAELPLADYDQLTAAEIVDKLPHLSQQELHLVDGYERRNRGRSTVVDTVTKLRGQEPWAGYDDMTVDEIVPRLSDLSSRDVNAVVTYESQHKNRRTIRDNAARASR